MSDELDDIFGIDEPAEPAGNPGTYTRFESVPTEPIKNPLLAWLPSLMACCVCVAIGYMLATGDHQGAVPDDGQYVQPDDGVVVGDEVAVIIVEESEERPPELAVLMRYQPWIDGLKESGVSFEVIDKDNPSSELSRYIEAVANVPAVLIVVDGQIVVNEPFPETKSDEKIDEMLKQRTGR